MARIVVIYDRFHPQIGGMERMIDELTRHLAAGHRVTVLAERARGLPRSARHGEVEVLRCRWWDGAAEPVLRRADVAIGFGYTPYSARSVFPLSVAARALAGGLPVAWCPTFYPPPADGSPGRRRKGWKGILPGALREEIRSRVARRYHEIFARSFALFALTEVERAHWRARLPHRAVHLCEHGVGRRHRECTDPVTAARRVRERFGPGPVVTSIGRVSAHKNQAVLVRAWPGVTRRFPSARLVLAGPCAGPEADAVRRLADSLGAPCPVIFAGAVTDAELCELYVGSSRIVHPSRHEASGLTPLEALAHATPAIHSGQGALERYGSLPGCETVERLDDPDAWSERIVRCLAELPEWERRAREGRDVVLGTHTWEAMAARIEGEIEAVLHRSAAPLPRTSVAATRGGS